MDNMMKNSNGQMWDIIVIGSGVSGLTASILLARSGKTVLLLEKSKKLGGRSMTVEKEGSYLNFGPHALYSKGKSMEILAELGIFLQGDNPDLGGKLFNNGQQYELPADPLKLLTSPLFNWKGKLELLRFFIYLKKMDSNENRDITVNQWLNQKIKDVHVKKFILMLLRLATYSSDPNLISANAAFRQLSLGKAIYLPYGWQTMIEALKEKALESGVTIKSGSSVHRVKGEFPQFEVSLRENETFFAQSVLSTASPRETAAMLQDHEQSSSIEFLNELIPIRAACMDFVLKEIPRPKIAFALSMDQPLYFSNHSKVVILSNDVNHSVIHVMKYLPSTENQDQSRDKYELEQFMSRLQPGWEQFVIYKRYLPKITVTHGMITAKKDRPDIGIEQIPGFFIAGDWVQSEGMLVDGSFSSAKKAAASIIEICK
jgi:phytoene dehydrogenase-like protein